MNIEKISRYWGIAALIAWGGLAIFFNLLRFDPYGIDETAAHALLLNWAVSDRVVNPIVYLGMPDFRAMVFFPLGAYWPGSFVALKVFMLLISFCAATMLYRWAREYYDGETALIASGLLLIAPMTLLQVNAVGAGPFLLLGFGIGYWLNKTFRKSGKQLSGWYFTQLLLCVALVSIHPAGLAYPLALAWEWLRDPISARHKKQMLIGLAIATFIIILLRFGWTAMPWFTNPMIPLGDILMGRIPGDPAPPNWGAGVLPALMIAATAWFGRRHISDNLLPRMLVIALVLGALAADHSWAFLGLAFILYCGTPLLIHFNSKLGQNSFVGQRGLVMLLLFVTTTLFMIGDRGYRSSLINNTMEPSDQIIKALATETEEIESSFISASEWPARTMLAVKRPVVPLPGASESPEALAQDVGDIAFIVFNPFNVELKPLRDQISNVTQEMETLIQQPGGVIVKVKKNEPSIEEAR